MLFLENSKDRFSDNIGPMRQKLVGLGKEEKEMEANFMR